MIGNDTKQIRRGAKSSLSTKKWSLEMEILCSLPPSNVVYKRDLCKDLGVTRLRLNNAIANLYDLGYPVRGNKTEVMLRSEGALMNLRPRLQEYWEKVHGS